VSGKLGEISETKEGLERGTSAAIYAAMGEL
jgi:hypothetical protein